MCPSTGRLLVDGIDISPDRRRPIAPPGGCGAARKPGCSTARVRENIAIADPAAPHRSRGASGASLAGAHDFISELTAAGLRHRGGRARRLALSGGQRQRIAIARALFTRPRILIFDEATSALDYESEAVIQQNMRAICEGRTVIVIAHRLSAVRHANAIIVMEQGRIVEGGTHAQLLGKAGGIYARLWAMQTGAPAAEKGAP